MVTNAVVHNTNCIYKGYEQRVKFKIRDKDVFRVKTFDQDKSLAVFTLEPIICITITSDSHSSLVHHGAIRTLIVPSLRARRYIIGC